MKIKDRETGAFIGRAELWLEGRHDVELLRELIEAYDRHEMDAHQTLVVPVPIPGDVKRQHD
jgi:hypothetical protein